MACTTCSIQWRLWCAIYMNNFLYGLQICFAKSLKNMVWTCSLVGHQMLRRATGVGIQVRNDGLTISPTHFSIFHYSCRSIKPTAIDMACWFWYYQPEAFVDVGQVINPFSSLHPVYTRFYFGVMENKFEENLDLQAKLL